MALVTTSGSATADSYYTLAELNAYWSARGNTTWTGSDSVKEAAAIKATVWVDFTYRARFPGQRTEGRAQAVPQALEWPRRNAYDRENELIASTVIPIEIKHAQAEAALRELVTPGSLSPDYVASEQVKSESVGPLSTEFFGGGGSSSVLPVVNIIDGILSSLIGGDVGFVMRA